MSDKLRPNNAAGPNGLRGGIKTYQPKTITGPWFDALGGAAGFKRGFTTPEYITEAQHQQLGASLKPPPEFGAPLPDDVQLKRPTSPFKYQTTNNSSSAWVTNTRLMSQAIVTQSKSHETPTALKPRLPAEQIEAYRRTWTTENETMREIRFSTESRRQGAAVGEKFRINSVRALPGTPKPYEQYRQAMIDKYGIFAFTVVRYSMGRSESISMRDFRQALRDSGVDLKLYEVNQIIAFVSPSSGAMNISQFIEILKGHVLGFERRICEDIFHFISQDIAQGRGVRTEDIVQAINQDLHPEIRVGVETYAEAAYADQGYWSLDAFVAFHHDLYAANPLDYMSAVKEVWRVRQ